MTGRATLMSSADGEVNVAPPAYPLGSGGTVALAIGRYPRGHRHGMRRHTSASVGNLAAAVDL